MPVCIKKAQTHHLDLRFLPLDGIIIFAFLYFVKGEFSSSYFLCQAVPLRPALRASDGKAVSLARKSTFVNLSFHLIRMERHNIPP